MVYDLIPLVRYQNIISVFLTLSSRSDKNYFNSNSKLLCEIESILVYGFHTNYRLESKTSGDPYKDIVINWAKMGSIS